MRVDQPSGSTRQSPITSDAALAAVAVKPEIGNREPFLALPLIAK
jgi:hypothetical protein